MIIYSTTCKTNFEVGCEMNRSLTNSSMHLVADEAAGAKEKKGAEKKARGRSAARGSSE